MFRKTLGLTLASISSAFLMLLIGLPQAQAAQYLTPQVFMSKSVIKTIPLRDMKNLNLPPIMRRVVGNNNYSKQQLDQLRQKLEQGGYIKAANQYFTVPLLNKTPAMSAAPVVRDPVLQTKISGIHPESFTVPIASFDGMGASTTGGDACAPPDTNAAAGANNQVVEIVNCAGGAGQGTFGVYSKTGTLLLGPVALGSLWTSGLCSTNGFGDNVVDYDQLAQRWIITQFAGSGVPTDECVAVSQTGDATGAYYVYDFPVFPGQFADYPKVAVWPDAYYASFNVFNGSGTAFDGAGFVAFERSAMLTGSPAQEVIFQVNNTSTSLAYSVLPADLDGITPPPAGDPGIFVDYVSPYLWGTSYYALEMWQLAVNWASPSSSTLTGPTQITVAAFNDGICGGSRACIPQPSPGEGLDALGDRLMFRLAYRVSTSDGHQVLVVNQTVGTGASPSSTPSGIRWYELDAPAGSTNPTQWTVGQQGTFMPADGSSRWMGSIAMDQSGNMALGYSLSSSSINPSIAYTGRLATDPPGTMTQPETTIITGGGVQESTADRWGDYSSMVLDPSDDCTFWYAQEYYATSGSFAWSTHLASFKFPTCTAGPTGILTGTVTDAGTGSPIKGATITVNPNGIVTTTDSSGNYTLTLPVGSYTAVASDFGYISQSDPETISQNVTTTQNFALTLAPTATVSGNITDGTPSGHTYGLYGEIKVTTPSVGQVKDIWSNPQTGAYSVNLPQGSDYTFAVTSYLSGYTPGSAAITGLSGNTTQNFPLTVGSSCSAPGYAFITGFGEDFTGGVPPAGWTVTNNVTGSPVVWNTNTFWRDQNYTGGSGIAATADSNNAYPYTGTYDTALVTPEILVSSLPANPVLEFALNYQALGGDALDVDVSGNGGTTWTNVAHITTSQGRLYALPGVNYQVPFTIPGGATQIELRWRYYDLVSGFNWYAQIDNVSIGACGVVSGGLVEGAVTDQNTSSGLVGATVFDSNTPSASTTTFTNAADSNLPAGYYFLFSDTNSADVITASDAGYANGTATLNVSDNSVTPQNFVLGAPEFLGTPGAFRMHVMVGTHSDQIFKIANNGTANGTFSFLTFDFAPPSSPLGGPGAPLNLIQCKHLSPISLVWSQGKGGQSPGCGSSPSAPDVAPWVNIANYPTPVMDNAAAEDESSGKVYDVGGYNGSSVVASGDVYDPGTGAWSPIADMPAALEKPVAAFISGKLYVTDGWTSSGGPSGALYIYDPSSNTWTTGANSNPAPEGGGAGVAVLNNQMYVIGGCPTGSSCGDTPVEAYNPSTGSWTAAGALARYPHAVSWESCGAVAGTLYCAGGTAGSSEYADGYVYNASGNSWSAIAPIPVAAGGLWGSGYIGTAQGLLVSGGVTNNFTKITNQGYAYTPSSNTWTALPNSNNTVYRGGSACGFYKIGGSIGGFSPVPNSELLPGYSPCGTSPIPWLGISKMTGPVAAGGVKNLRFRFKGAGQQEYTVSQAYLLLEGTPYAPQMIPLKIHWDPQPIDLAVVPTANLNKLYVGGNLIFSVKLRNLNEAGHGAASQVTLTYPLPAGVNYLSSLGDGTCTFASNTVTCTFPNLPVGGREDEQINVVPSIPGTVISTFTVSGREPDTNPSNNTASVSTTVLGIAHMTLKSFTVNPGTVNVGDKTIFSLAVANTGPGTATGVKVEVPLPAYLSYISASASAGSCSNSSGLVTCRFGDMQVGGSASAKITVVAKHAGLASTMAVVSATSKDPKTSNHSVMANVKVNAQAQPPTSGRGN